MSQNNRQGKSVFNTQATQAALWKVLSCACFAGISGLVHALTRLPEKLPPCEIAFFQTSSAALFLGVFWLNHLSKGGGVTLQQPFLALTRALCLVIGVSLWFTSLKYLPLADIAAFKLLSPLMVMCCARLFLKESLSTARLVALGGCLIGAGFLFQKEFSKGWQGNAYVAYWAILLPFLSLCAYTMSTLLAKRLLRKDDPQKVTLSLLVLATPFLGILTALEWVTPSLAHFPFLMAIGVLSGVAYYALNKALDCADITYLMPFGLTRFVVSMGVAYVFFGETLGVSLLIGSFLIILTSFWLMRREAQKELSPPPSSVAFNP